MKFETVRDVIVETLGCEAEQVVPEARLTEELGADSLASVELVMALEEATGLTIEEEAMARIKTVGDIMNHLTSLEG